jgi:putative polyhydroxyalkanoate system protein
MTIEIHHPHSKPHDEARQLAENVANKMQTEFSMKWHWEGNVLHFDRSGVSGTLDVTPSDIVVRAKLGFLLSALQPKIESEIHRFLNEQFG